MDVAEAAKAPTSPLHFFREAPSLEKQRWLPCNVGGADRALRASVAVVSTGVALTAPKGPLRTIAWAVAGMAWFTTLSRYCPANQLLGINTCEE